MKKRETENIKEIDCSISDYRGKVMHRLEYENGKKNVVINNCIPWHYHLLEPEISELGSKL